eukprot:Gb_09779 [translate_table: standard]
MFFQICRLSASVTRVPIHVASEGHVVVSAPSLVGSEMYSLVPSASDEVDKQRDTSHSFFKGASDVTRVFVQRLLDELEEIDFNQRELNAEVLRRNNYDSYEVITLHLQLKRAHAQSCLIVCIMDMKETLEDCEQPTICKERKYCATSLESMVNFSTSKLGVHVNVLAMTVPKQSSKRIYTITTLSFESKFGSKCISRVKMATLQHDVVCHSSTNAWNP